MSAIADRTLAVRRAVAKSLAHAIICAVREGRVDEAKRRREAIDEQFAEAFGHRDYRLFRAPGRVNLIGEHTDYNDGFVLPVAIDRHVMVAAAPRSDRTVCAYSVNFGCHITFSLDHIEFDANHPWSNYLRGVAFFLEESGLNFGGFDAVYEGNVPIGAGLSSSAAIEVATAFALQGLFDFGLSPEAMALLCQRAENEFVGMRCGIMDQLISRAATPGHAMFIDCRSLAHEAVSLSANDPAIVICDSGIKRELAASEYNTRREQCEAGVGILRRRLPDIAALRDVTIDQFHAHSDTLPSPIRERCAHVIEENDRVLRSLSLLRERDLTGFGRLMNQSHDSLRDQYEVSCPELDTLVQSAQAVAATLGSRMTGAGFGGCTVSLVAANALDEFREDVTSAYQERFGRRPEIYVTPAVGGASELSGSAPTS
jgi:galactokinase